MRNSKFEIRNKIEMLNSNALLGAAKGAILGLVSTLLIGCVSVRQTGESVVLVGEQPAALAHVPKRHQAVRVRSTYLGGQTNSIQYIEGHDFMVDYGTGTLKRTSNSRLPDFQTNVLFGQENFDHSKFPGYGNNPFFAYVDYSFKPTARWPIQAPQPQFLKGTLHKLKAGQSLKMVAFGDSITAGGEASRPELIFWQRWAGDLQQKHPTARVTAVNGATGGDTTVQGLQRLDAKVLKENPDLVLIAFGMNDHNVGSVPLPQFEKNLKEMIDRIRKGTGAEVILLSTFPPNPKWKFGSHHMADYAAATERVAKETESAYADVFNNWQAIAARKKPEDLLANNINHPNDFGHCVYFRVLQQLGL
jgi:acyl-CoA thioesterase-1